MKIIHDGYVVIISESFWQLLYYKILYLISTTDVSNKPTTSGMALVLFQNDFSFRWQWFFRSPLVITNNGAYLKMVTADYKLLQIVWETCIVTTDSW